MVLNCDTKTTKIIGSFICVAYAIAGMVMLGEGISLYLHPWSQAYELSSHWRQIITLAGETNRPLGIMMIVLGVFSIISALLLICAILLEIENSIPLLVLLVILILANVALLAFAACYPSESYLKDHMRKNMITNFATQDIKHDGPIILDLPPERYANAWAYLQIEAKCCGVEGPEDYKQVPIYNRSEIIYEGEDPMAIPVPLSCCDNRWDLNKNRVITNINNCIAIGHPTSLHREGCLKTVSNFFSFTAIPAYQITPILIIFQLVLVAICIRFIFFNKYQEIK